MVAGVSNSCQAPARPRSTRRPWRRSRSSRPRRARRRRRRRSSPCPRSRGTCHIHTRGGGGSAAGGGEEGARVGRGGGRGGPAGDVAEASGVQPALLVQLQVAFSHSSISNPSAVTPLPKNMQLEKEADDERRAVGDGVHLPRPRRRAARYGGGAGAGRVRTRAAAAAAAAAARLHRENGERAGLETLLPHHLQGARAPSWRGPRRGRRAGRPRPAPLALKRAEANFGLGWG